MSTQIEASDFFMSQRYSRISPLPTGKEVACTNRSIGTIQTIRNLLCAVNAGSPVQYSLNEVEPSSPHSLYPGIDRKAQRVWHILIDDPASADHAYELKAHFVSLIEDVSCYGQCYTWPGDDMSQNNWDDLFNLLYCIKSPTLAGNTGDLMTQD